MEDKVVVNTVFNKFYKIYLPNTFLVRNTHYVYVVKKYSVLKVIL